MQNVEQHTLHALAVLAVWEMSYEDWPAATQQIRDMSNVQKILELLLFNIYIYMFYFVPVYFSMMS